MILDLKKLVEKHSLDIRGVIHIGAHYGGEDRIYSELSIGSKIYVEPIKETFRILTERHAEKEPGDRLYFNTALGNFVGEAEMVLSSNSNESASILKPKNHLQLHGWVQFNGTETVKVDKLDNLEFDRTKYNMINIDVQGYELEVFKGGAETLNNIDYIMAEINRDEVYENCAHIDDVCEFLAPYGFKLVEEHWAGGQWGDGFFIRE